MRPSRRVARAIEAAYLAPCDHNKWFSQMSHIRQETHYDGRQVYCYAPRPPDVYSLLAAAAAAFPQKTAFVDDSRSVTYAEFERDVACVAANLARFGVERGDRVGLVLGNRIEFPEIVFACARLGAVVVPINIRQQLDENRFVVSHAGIKALVHEARFADRVPKVADGSGLAARFSIGGDVMGSHAYADLQRRTVAPPPAQVGEEETAAILYTSGTTGVPKGAMLTHLGVIHSCLHICNELGLGPDDVSLLAVPASHVTGLVAQIYAMAMAQGATVMVSAFNAKDCLAKIAAERITLTVLVPAMYNLFLLEPSLRELDFSSWRLGASGGALMPEATLKALAEALPNVTLANSYGATEATSPACLMPLGEQAARLDTVGKVLPCARIKVVDEEEREVGFDELGEIWIAGPMVVPGYWRNDEANRNSFAGGYWKSGDIGSIDADGYVKVVDRKKDMVNRGGYKVYSVEVENVLSHHPQVLEVAIIAHPDPVLGERSHAYIFSKGGEITRDDIRNFCKARLADYKTPDFVTVCAEPLPRNANGKILKPALRERLKAELAGKDAAEK
jgi:acyl-CoA synthetase (AMP-forming)/AMP-acid ligase II